MNRNERSVSRGGIHGRGRGRGRPPQRPPTLPEPPKGPRTLPPRPSASSFPAFSNFAASTSQGINPSLPQSPRQGISPSSQSSSSRRDISSSLPTTIPGNKRSADDEAIQERLAKNPKFEAVRERFRNLSMDDLRGASTLSPTVLSQAPPPTAQPRAQTSQKQQHQPAPTQNTAVPLWQRTADLNTAPPTLHEAHAVVKLRQSKFGMGALSKEQIESEKLPFQITVTFNWGKDNLDPGFSVNFSFNKAWNETWKKENSRIIRFKARTGQQGSLDEWMLQKLSAQPAISTNLRTSPFSCSVNNGSSIADQLTSSPDKIAVMQLSMVQPLVTKSNLISNLDEFMVEMKDAGRPREERNLVKEFCKAEDLNLVVFFNLRQQHARDFVDNDFARFKSMVDIHLPPLSPYCRPTDNNCNKWVSEDIGLDFPKARQFQNGLLCKWTQEKREEIERLQKAGQDISEVEPEIKQLPFVRNFPDLRSLRICLSIAVVREYQAGQAALRPFMARSVTVTAIKAPEVIGESRTIFFFVVTLPKYLQGIRLPEESTDFEISSPQRLGLNDRLVGVIKKFESEDRAKLGEGDFLISVGLAESRVPSQLNAAQGWGQVTAANSFNATITPVIDNTSAQRVLNAVRVFTDEETPFQGITLPAYLNGNPNWNLRLDITVGPIEVGYIDGNRDNPISSEGQQNRILYDLSLKIFDSGRRKLAVEQLKLLDRAKNIQDDTFVIQGCPGSGKTMTTSVLVFILLLIGHKIVLGAKVNNAVDHYSKEMALRRGEFIRLATKMLKADDDELDPNEKVLLTRLLAKAKFLSIVRFLPLNQEAKLLKSKIVTPDDNGIIDTSTRNDHLQHYYDLLVSRYCAERTAFAAQEANNADALEAERANWATINQEVREYEHTYDHLPITAQRNYAFPAEHQILHYIKHAEEFLMQQDPSNMPRLTPLQQAVLNFQAAEKALQHPDDNPACSLQGLREAVTTARERMFGATIAQCSMVITTCIGASHPLLKEHFSPTGAVLEEAETVDIGTALCLWSYKTQWRLSIGDINQSEPFHAAGSAAEVRDLVKLSDLDAWMRRLFTTDFLLEQKRSIPDIMHFINQEFYGGKMTDGADNKQMHKHPTAVKAQSVVPLMHVPYPNLKIDEKGYFYVVNVDGNSETPSGSTSQINFKEAEMILHHVLHFCNAGIRPDQITIIFYYLDQMNMFRRWLRDPQLQQLQDLKGIQMSSVDTYSGEANDVILVATTATVAWPEGQRPMWSPYVTKRNRLCVALSRARYFCAIYGNWVRVVRIFIDSRYQKHWRPMFNLAVDAFDRHRLMNTTAWREGDICVIESKRLQHARQQQANFDFAVERLTGSGFARRIATADTIEYAGPNQGTAKGKYSFDTRRLIQRGRGSRAHPVPDQDTMHISEVQVAADEPIEEEAADNLKNELEAQEMALVLRNEEVEDGEIVEETAELINIVELKSKTQRRSRRDLHLNAWQ